MPGRLLRVVTAGSVDDGKSTLVGRLLHDAKAVLTDQLTAVEVASERRGYDGADLALLVDGLRAEREQGITIDVAYRYFATARRTFILADTPGHVQYTRNTVTGASTADVAVILVDARNGVVEQTKRHVAVASLLRVRHVVLAVNKMDLVDFAEEVFDRIVTDFAGVAETLGLDTSPRSRWPRCPATTSSTVSADGLVRRTGPAGVPGGGRAGPERRAAGPVPGADGDPAADRGSPDYRGYAGRVEAGALHVGDQVVVLPSGRRSTVGRDRHRGRTTGGGRRRPVGRRAADRRRRHRPW